MLVGFCTFDQHVAGIGFHIMPNLVFEHLVDKALICSPCIFQSKMYHFITIHTFIGYEHHLLLTFESHLNLTIAGESIHEA